MLPSASTPLDWLIPPITDSLNPQSPGSVTKPQRLRCAGSQLYGACCAAAWQMHHSTGHAPPSAQPALAPATSPSHITPSSLVRQPCCTRLQLSQRHLYTASTHTLPTCTALDPGTARLSAPPSKLMLPPASHSSSAASNTRRLALSRPYAPQAASRQDCATTVLHLPTICNQCARSSEPNTPKNTLLSPLTRTAAYLIHPQPLPGQSTQSAPAKLTCCLQALHHQQRPCTICRPR